MLKSVDTKGDFGHFITTVVVFMFDSQTMTTCYIQMNHCQVMSS